MPWEDEPVADVSSFSAYLLATAVSIFFLLLSVGMGWAERLVSHFVGRPVLALTGAAFFTMLALTAAPSAPPVDPHPQGWGRPRLIMTLLVLIAFFLGSANADCRPPSVLPSTYCFLGATMTSDTAVLYEWCADCGTNRFVTNDINDFIPVQSITRKPMLLSGAALSPHRARAQSWSKA